jgi:2-amino-4-hydroxy-6-hydroxymethyldihydropteridine diphosphokinase
VSESVFIGLGSNVGDREAQLLLAVQALSRIDAVAVLRRSSLYDSAPLGPKQPRYLNAAVQIECGLSPQRLLGILKQIEKDLGRQTGGHWERREIDLDVLLWEGKLVTDANLQVPHLELHNRAFALEPLCELAPRLVHPVLNEPLSRLLTRLSPQDVVRLESPRWPGTLS